MGVKSTHYVTRAEALNWLLITLPFASDEALADVLERVNDDKSAGGEGFENYIIREE